MRAIHKYKNSKHKEAQRRIAQSFGYRISIMDSPEWIALLQRAGIDITGTELSAGDVIEL
jgi:hypothetical protein